ncbi:hypothetical protein EYF80_012294 [Liparis tanakae]|uniref:Uncharacterized protein n=1 Tax=Liparis tanakae TaxID=230148 RepID=A0A4Z2IHM5_9TELE|nr:hypothetical protein EYF80_012294 [Liparis tanakae]
MTAVGLSMYLGIGEGNVHDDRLAPGVDQLVASDLAVLLHGQRRLPAHPESCGVEGIRLNLPGRGSGHCSTTQHTVSTLESS